MKKDRKVFKLGIVLAAALMLFTSSGVTAQAIGIDDIIFSLLSETDREKNLSYLSYSQIYIGEGVSIIASSDGLDESKCKYAFYARKAGESWDTLQGYSALSTCYFVPQSTGSYEICVKIRCGLKIYKEYLSLTVTRPIVNGSVISSSYIPLGDHVKLSAAATGGEGGFVYRFLEKRTDEGEWTELSDYSTADNMQWNPQYAGEYDIVIDAKDAIGNTKSKEFKLVVADERKRTPEEFTITVKAPISSPYLWSCEFSDESILKYTVTRKSYDDDMFRPYVLLEYKFTPVASGAADIILTYNAYNGNGCRMIYNIVSDRNLSFTVNSVTGKYFDEKLPEVQQIKRRFMLGVSKSDNEHIWRCEISNGLVIEYDKTATGSNDYDTYYFNALRKGYSTITLTCYSKQNVTDQYKLIYTIYIDDELKVTTISCDGRYFDDLAFPVIVQG